MAAKKIDDAIAIQLSDVAFSETATKHTDANQFWSSTLFSDVYLRNDVPLKYSDIWDSEDTGPFSKFLEQFRRMCNDLRGEAFDSWSERRTITTFIKKVLPLLGWTSSGTEDKEPWLEDETLTQREHGISKSYKPDFIIVDNAEYLKHIENKSGDAKLEEARTYSIITIEAKYWGRIDESRYEKKEDRTRADKRNMADSARSLDFDEQCLKYVDLLHHDYGILTDGKTWRLYHRELSSGYFKRYYQFNLGKLVKHVLAGMDTDVADYRTFVENAKYFYHLFSKSALHNSEGGRRFVDDLIEDSKKYASQVEEDLKLRFVNAMAISCNGFRKALGKVPSSKELDLIRSVSESHIFNILFIRYCESRNILPLRQNPEYRRISISNVIDKLDLFDPEKEKDDLNTLVLKRRFREDFGYDPSGFELYDRILELVTILQTGLNHPAAKFSIAGFRETVFSPEELTFTKKHKLTNRNIINLLFELTYIESDRPGKFQQIAYTYFAPRQLGSIYESFLEYQLEKADSDMAFFKGQWKPTNLNSDKLIKSKAPTVKKGDLFFTPNNDDRKETGSYYTPDLIVQYVLDKSLSKLIESHSSKEILQLRICDPSMGSGHFLAGVLDYLARAFLKRLDDEEAGDVELTLREAKRLVLEKCIFGVDINPRAVKLAKMSLWLESAAANLPLEPLDDQLVAGDSLSIVSPFDWKAVFPDIHRNGGFDCVVGNPPWVSFGLRGTAKLDSKVKDRMKTLFPNSAEYKICLYTLFMELAIKLTREGGFHSFIVPDSFLLGMYFSKIRSFILECTTIDSILLINADFWGKAVSGSNIIYSVKKTAAAATKRDDLEVTYADGLKSLQTGNVTRRSMRNTFDELRRKKFRIFFDDAVESFVTLMDNDSKPLDTFGTVRTGVRSKVGQKGIITERQTTKTHQKGITSGSNVRDYRVTWTNEFINIKKDLLNAGGWDYDVIHQPKILIRQTGDDLIAGIDRASLYHLNNCHSYVSDKSDVPVEYVCALLNSKAMRAYYRYITLECGRTMAQTDIEVLESLPVKIPSAAILAKIVASVRALETIAPQSKKYNDLVSTIEGAISTLYGLQEVPSWVIAAEHFYNRDALLPAPKLTKLIN